MLPATRRIHTLKFLSNSSWPYAVKRLPFFYGWAVLAVSTLGQLMSIPGQTIGMAVFTDHFIDSFGLSRTQLSIAYLLGTISSALFLTRAGRLYDRLGARAIMVGSSVLLGLALAYIAMINALADLLGLLLPVSSTVITFALICIGYFGVRFAGQGVLFGAATNVLLVWFERRRGMVSGARAVFTTLGFSTAPVIFAAMIGALSWRGALFVLAATVGVGFSIAALVSVRNTPESCGLLPDGVRLDENKKPAGAIPDVTYSDARRRFIFWIYSLVLALHSLFGTAVVFHIVAIFSESGRTANDAFAYFLPAAVVAVSVNLFSSWLSDHVALKLLLVANLVAFVVATIGLLSLEHGWGYWVFVAGIGSSSGLWGVLSNITFIRFFGRRHLGEISGLNLSMSVVGSAIGPALFSVGNDLFGTYHAGVWLTMGATLVLLFLALFARQVEPSRLAGS